MWMGGKTIVCDLHAQSVWEDKTVHVKEQCKVIYAKAHWIEQFLNATRAKNK